MKTPSLSHHRSGGGFTLLEMMITLAIFLLLAGAVFGILTGVLQSTAALQNDQSRRDQITALNAYLKKKLGEMPARSSLVSYQRGDGEGLVQNGIIFGNTNFATAIDAKIQPNGYYTLRLSTFETAAGPNDPPDARTALSQSVTTDDPTLIWTTLVSDIKTLDWKFLDFNSTLWVEIWSSSTQPNLAELSVQLGGDLQPTTMDFWLPKIDTISINAAARAASTSH
jgi:prepilin-type N-terminal cleavage/methylation domain-containing protein